MSPRKLGSRSDEPQDFYHELLGEAHLSETGSAVDSDSEELQDGPAADADSGTEASHPGYEEFAEIPTGSFSLPEEAYGSGSPPAYSDADSTAGRERSSQSRKGTQGRTGKVLKVPLREMGQDRVLETEAGQAEQSAPDRRRNRALAWLFCGFIFGLLLLLIVLPKSYFSDEERQVLAEEPQFSARTVFDGTFEEDAETYVSDHFPFRTFWVGLNSYADLASGRPLINTVYVGRDGYFIDEPTVYDEAKIAANMSAVRTFLAERQLPAAVLAVPSAGSIMRDMLPTVHLPYRDSDILATARLHLDGMADWIDVSDALGAESAVEQVYYRTDHHWTTLGAYIGYIRWAEQQGVTPTPVDRFRISFYDGFRGTTYAKVLLWNVKPDMIQLWENGGSYSVEMQDGNQAPVMTDTFYDMGALTGYDPYMVFFGGNHGLMHIRNNNTQVRGTLLIIKDSYANCLIPFIAPHYKELYVVDPRYYKNLRGLCDETAFDSVLFVYGVNSLVNDQDLGLIDM